MNRVSSRLFGTLISFAVIAGGAGALTLATPAAAAIGGPTVVLASTSASTTDSASIPVTATFSESVTGFSSTSVSVVNATVTNFSGSGASYAFNLHPSATGTVSVMLPADSASSTSSHIGNLASNTLTFTSALPTISGITVSGVGTTGATVGWMTDLPSSSLVLYGTTASYGSVSTLDTAATTTHTVALTGLSEGTVYHFAVRSGSEVGTTTSADQILVTRSTASSTPLAVTGVDSVSSVATADNSFADGWTWVLHLTVPDNETAFRMKFADFTTASSSSTVPAAGNIRISSPESSNASTPEAGIISMGNGYGSWIYLTGDTAPQTPGRQVDVTINVKIPSGTAAASYTTTYGAQSVPSTATSTTP